MCLQSSAVVRAVSPMLSEEDSQLNRWVFINGSTENSCISWSKGRQAGKETSGSEELYAAVCRRARVWLLKCLLEKNLNIYIINSPSHLIIPVTLLCSSLLFASPAFKHGTSCAEGDIFQRMFLSKSLNSSFDNLTLTR